MKESLPLNSSNKKSNLFSFNTPVIKPIRKISAVADETRTDALFQSMDNKLENPYIIGICGGAQSGKSLVASQIEKVIGESKAVIVSLENFYKPARGKQLRQDSFNLMEKKGSKKKDGSRMVAKDSFDSSVPASPEELRKLEFEIGEA